MKTLGEYFRIGDRAVLEETYEAMIKSAVNSAPQPIGIPLLLRSKKQHPKARNAKPEDCVGELDQSGFIKALLAGGGRVLRCSTVLDCKSLKKLCWATRQ
jgi:hypothetical protein